MGLSLAGATLGAGIMSGISSAFGAYQSGKDAQKATQMQINWERERATHAHQWEVEDLKAAGLNPILSAGGSGAVTGGISAPIPDRTGYANIGNAFADAMNTITNTALAGAQTKNTNEDTKVKAEQANLIAQQTLNEAVKNGLLSAQKASIEFENLQKQYNWDKRDLTYWNDFINKATGSARNTAEAISLPKLLNIFKKGKGRDLSPEKLEKLLYGGKSLGL